MNGLIGSIPLWDARHCQSFFVQKRGGGSVQICKGLLAFHKIAKNGHRIDIKILLKKKIVFEGILSRWQKLCDDAKGIHRKNLDSHEHLKP